MDEKYMLEALKLAEKAMDEDEIPVGAIIVKNNEIIGCGYNQKERTKNPLKHAELMAIEEACKKIGDWRLNGCVLYVTLEPCPMCMGAIVETRLDKVVYGLSKNEHLYENDVAVVDGILEEKCLILLQKFFKNKRNK